MLPVSRLLILCQAAPTRCCSVLLNMHIKLQQQQQLQPASPYATLPHLPVPPLQQTLKRFLDVAKPLVSSNEYLETLKLVDVFAQTEGPKLQALLEERAKKTENWLADWWLQIAYLEQRCPIVVNVSPGLSFPMQKFSGLDGQIKFASRLIVALLKYKALIDSDKLPADTASNQPLDMSQYSKLFGTCRIPGVKHDSLIFEDKAKRAQHIVLAYDNNFFRVPVYNDAGHMLNESQIESQLHSAVENAPESTKGFSPTTAVGLLTTEERSTWGHAYQRLRSCSKNTKALDAIERSLFLVCIDQPVKPLDGSILNEMGRQMLHGGGSKQNSGNRWFDKTMQFVIGHDGACGMTYEHSPAEGPPIAALMDFCMDYIYSKQSLEAQHGQYHQPERLNFSLIDDDKRDIANAAQNINTLATDVDVCMLVFEEFGKNVPKSFGLSPDSFLQLSYQLAHHKMHGSCPATYETGTLRRFHLGRTDTIRLPSLASVEFVKAMREKAIDAKQKAQLLRRAVQAHKEYTAAACSGNGIDRHLLGLKLIAVENNMNVPKLLMGSAYTTAMHYKLSTSQVAAKHDATMLFGPMYPDCYGICYNPQESRVNISVTAFNSFPETNAKRFAEILTESLKEMKQVLVEGDTPKVKSRL